MESMAAIVSKENRTRTSVRQYMCAIFQGVKPMTKPEMIAATKIPEPVAVSQFSVYTAASGVGLGTTGGMRCTILFRPTTGNFGAESLSSWVLTLGSPQTKTTMLKIIHGTHAFA